MREKEVWVVDFGESVDVGMFGVGGPPLKKKMRKDGRQLRERWIAHAVELLRAHKGHMGIIIYLRGEGLSAEIAKQTSYDIFDEAKGRFKKRQRWLVVLAWILIAVGLGMPVVQAMIGMPVVLIWFGPFVAGVSLLGRLHNPGRLPEE